MDAMTFGTPILLRHLNFSEARKMPVQEIHLETVLQEMGLTSEQVFSLFIFIFLYLFWISLLTFVFCLDVIIVNPFVVLEW